MARKQAKRRKPTRSKKRIELPNIYPSRILAPLAAAAIVVLTYDLSARLFDRPIETIAVNGPFQRVNALDIEAAVGADLGAGFLAADVDALQEKIANHAWVDQATVARRWPNRLEISFTEQMPAAVWGERGLLNARGELFLREARHTPAELPRLYGPAGRSVDVAERYLDVRQRLIPLGLDLKSVELDARGAWRLQLANGIEVRLGRREVDERTQVFLDVATDLITNRAADIDYLDMRYSNGVSVGWKHAAGPLPAAEDDEREATLLARGGLE